MSFIIEKDKSSKVYNLENAEILPNQISSTFHGRDILSYYTAHISTSTPLEKLGKQINQNEIRRIELIPKFADNCIYGEVIHIDNFGNIITNVDIYSISKLGDYNKLTIEIKNKRINGLKRTFSDVSEDELLAYIGSLNYLEIAKNMGNASKSWKIKCGDSLRISLQITNLFL